MVITFPVIQSQGISQSSVDFPANPDITAGQFKQSVRTGDPGKNTFTVHITEFPDGQVRGPLEKPPFPVWINYIRQKAKTGGC